jgi:glutathione-regulated potassium-efflux system ancillary protein KefG
MPEWLIFTGETLFMKNKILLIFAHPLYEKSRIHSALLTGMPHHSGIRLHDLYQNYPDFNIDVDREQELLLEHDIIIWQHPVYWYSVPPLLKQWIDMVLEFGWAYGKNGNALEGKYLMQCMSSGGRQDAYTTGGRNNRPLREYMAAHEQTAKLCKMNYLPPFVVHGSHLLTNEEIINNANSYHRILSKLANTDLSAEDWNSMTYINEWDKED